MRRTQLLDLLIKCPLYCLYCMFSRTSSIARTCGPHIQGDRRTEKKLYLISCLCHHLIRHSKNHLQKTKEFGIYIYLYICSTSPHKKFSSNFLQHKNCAYRGLQDTSSQHKQKKHTNQMLVVGAERKTT